MIFVVSHFGFEDRIASVPGHCILVTLYVVFVISRDKGFYFALNIQRSCLTLQ